MERPVSPTTAEVREALEQILTHQPGPELPIVGFERRPSIYRSSFPLDELRVAFGDGTTLDLLFKDVNRQSLSETGRQAKPEFLHDPLREIETYRSLLADEHLGTARFYGTVVDRAQDRYWLFLEKVAADELYKVGEFSIWESAARWLAGMHARFATHTRLTAPGAGHWLKYDAEYFRLWMRRAQDLNDRTTSSRDMQDRHSIARLATHYERVVERLAALPVTFVHGEFYASNVLIGHGGSHLRVCPVDWEMSGLGTGLIDLAALTSGRWTEEQRTALARAYHAALAEQSREVPGQSIFLRALDDCRLHLAVQWLGWSENWSPPVEHAQDWLGEALNLADKVGCL